MSNTTPSVSGSFNGVSPNLAVLSPWQGKEFLSGMQFDAAIRAATREIGRMMLGEGVEAGDRFRLPVYRDFDNSAFVAELYDAQLDETLGAVQTNDPFASLSLMVSAVQRTGTKSSSNTDHTSLRHWIDQNKVGRQR